MKQKYNVERLPEVILKPACECVSQSVLVDDPPGGTQATNLGFTPDVKDQETCQENLKMPYFLLTKSDEKTQPVTIEDATDDQVEAQGYIVSPCKKALFYLAAVLSAGLFLLLMKWRPAWEVWLTCRPCSITTATVLILKDLHGDVSVVKVHIQSVSASLPPELVYSRSLSSISSHQQDSMNFNYSPASSYRYFMHNCVKYVWDNKKSCFKRLRGYDSGVIISDFYDKFHGLLAVEQEQKLQLYGPNVIDIEVKSYFRLFIDEVLNPFYIFQVASMILWLLDNYVYYACCILVISLVSIAVSLYETKKQRVTLKDMVANSNAVVVTVRRQDGVYEDVNAANLVPGDIIVIPPHGCLMACDAVLIAGNCIVNESLLTGESLPETKTPLPKQDDEMYNPLTHKRHTLFCGTQVIQTRYYEDNKVLAVVVGTGFSTAKGELVRSILFPKPMGFKFYKDSVRFVILLFFISAAGMGYSIYCYVIRNSTASETIVRTLDIITIVVPPALPAAMTIGTVYAQNRLKKQGIFCISPLRINVGGKLKLICFDKTGTLTEEGLDMWGVIPVSDGHFRDLEHDASVLPDRDLLKVAMACCHTLTVIDCELRGDPLDLKMFEATKWELEEPGADTTKFDILNPTVVRPPTSLPKRCESDLETVDSVISQDSDIDSKLISFPLSPTKNKDLMDPEIPYEVGIIRQFPFSSGLQRMSIISRTLGSKNMDLFCKGAPEKISSLCLPHTVPGTFPDLLKDYALQGFRVIALAHRKLDSKLSWHHAQKIKRDQVENDLTFLGLLIMQNTLKPETSPVIKTLKDAKIFCVMVTGDNVMTAMSVARDCGMIPETDKIIVVYGFPPEHNKPAYLKYELAETPTMLHSNSTLSNCYNNCNKELNHLVDLEFNNYHFVMDGKSFGVARSYFSDLLRKIIVRGSVFARMAPDQKTQLVQSLQDVGYVVGMCGDGANDCGALKAADVGISLSEAEASVAAPFTCKIPDIRCVPIVIREGRCALVTSFSTFKFIAWYSLTQFISVLILYTVDTNLTDQMFLYIDLPIITALAVIMGYTKAYEKLVPQRPRSSLISVPNVVSLLVQIIFLGLVQVGSLIYLQMQPWYVPVHSEGDITPCWENTTIFLVSCYQYVIIALLVSDGPPYRKRFYTNVIYVSAIIIVVAFTTLLLFNPFPKLAVAFAIVKWQPNHHFNFRLTLLLAVGCNLFTALAFEMMVSQSRWLRSLSRILKSKTEPKNEYKRIENEISQDHDWPRLNEAVYSKSPILNVQ